MKPLRAAVQTLRNIANSKGGQDLEGWLKHGGTELANVMVHGHPAPMYGHHASPPDQLAPETDFDKHNQDAEQRDADHAKSRLDRASQGMKSRMETEPPQRPMEMER